jgi:hypothetical protein
MKKIVYLFSLFAFVLTAQETKIPIEQSVSEDSKKTVFGYFALGGCGFVLPVLSPEAAVGIRKLTAKHAWDVQSGSSLMGKYFWGQASYLHFFLPTNKSSYSSPYLGIGLSGGYSRLREFNISKSTSYVNVPITVGFQWGENQRNQFFQIQFSPLLITTASFGVGF